MSTKKEILQVIAQEHVKRGGLKGFSFRTLADEAGIKSSSVHYYFPEKSDLAASLIERYTIAMMDDLETISANSSWNLAKKLNAFIKIFDDVARDNAVCLCGMLAAEHDELNEGNREDLNQFFRKTEKWLSKVLTQHTDELATTLPPLQLARTILSGLEGALLVDRVAANRQCLVAQKALILSYLR